MKNKDGKSRPTSPSRKTMMSPRDTCINGKRNNTTKSLTPFVFDYNELLKAFKDEPNTLTYMKNELQPIIRFLETQFKKHNEIILDFSLRNIMHSKMVHHLLKL